jgi:hypothetical protein
LLQPAGMWRPILLVVAFTVALVVTVLTDAQGGL